MSYDLTNPYQRLTALQIIDVNINRASEGLRVVEEYCRFVLSDAPLTARCKELRDQLHAATDPVSRAERLMARDTINDVGASLSFGETFRHDVSIFSLEQIAAKNGERVKEALRVIEEYCKALWPEVARPIGMLRYQWYTLERDCQLHAKEARALADERLYVLIDGGSSECAFVERVKSLISGGVHILQLRDKELDDRTLLSRARLLRAIIAEQSTERRSVPSTQYSVPTSSDATSRTGAPSPSRPLSPSPPLLIMNDRPDLAVLARADGVHVGQDELEVRDVRRIVGPQMLIGLSTHNIEQARQAVRDGADYIGCGPTFPSETKQFDHFPGLDFLRQVAAEISLPAFAIGGITLENLPQVLNAGFQRVAVGGAIGDANDVAGQARLFLARLER